MLKYQILKIAVIVFASIGGGCANHLDKYQLELIREIDAQSPKVFFERNRNNNELCFYAWGDSLAGYSTPGLTPDEINLYVKDMKIPVEVKYIDDPGPIGESEEYWGKVEQFLITYNRLVVEELKNRLH